jgi:uncharacterized protein YyaL (SSP411 family)
VTGYIIPTFFDYARLTKRDEFFTRADLMAAWESAIQLPNGAVQASTVDATEKVPTVFNTGMVIFGWVRAYEETKNDLYLSSALRAGEWLTSVQDGDGAWRKYGSPVTCYALNTYNTRVAWSLLDLYRVTDDARFRDSALRNLDWALTQQQPNGWLENNCLLDNRQPYTHTIAYAMRGFIEGYAFAGESRYLEAAQRLLDPVLVRVRNDGFLAGRFDRAWKPTVRYCCLTGSAQLALNACRLHELTGNTLYREGAEKLLSFVLRTQDTRTNNDSIRGAIGGSYPLKGGYHPSQFPSWAAKFAADAIMILTRLRNAT